LLGGKDPAGRLFAESRRQALLRHWSLRTATDVPIMRPTPKRIPQADLKCEDRGAQFSQKGKIGGNRGSGAACEE